MSTEAFDESKIIEDPEKKAALEQYIVLDSQIKQLESMLASKKAEKAEAVKGLGFESESDQSFLGYLEKVQQTDVYKTVSDSLKLAGGALVDFSQSELVKNVGSGVKKMAIGLAKSLTTSLSGSQASSTPNTQNLP